MEICSNKPKNEEQNTFYSDLSPSDKFQYDEMRQRFSSCDNKYNRNRRLETFQENLDEIKKFCLRGNEDDRKRLIACGVCWIKDGIATNIRQLKYLLGKSKSTINGSLQKMGYDTIPPKGLDAIPLIEALPYLENNFNELRQWTIRRLNNQPKELPKSDTVDNQNKPQRVTFPSIIPENIFTIKPCAFGCTCGCDCKINGEATRPCYCIYPDGSYEFGKDVCNCVKHIDFSHL